VLAHLRAAGIEVAGFIDDTPSKEGTEVAGVRVLAPRELAGRRCALAVTMLNAALPFERARERLAGLVEGPLVSVFELTRALPEAVPPMLSVEGPRELLRRAEDIRATARLLEPDAESFAQLLGHLRFRLELAFEALPPPTQPAYFPPELRDALPPGFRFADCGAYDGDTIRDLMALRPDFGSIVAFEPGRASFERLEAYVRGLPSQIAARIEPRQEALGATPGRLRFLDTGDTSAHVSAHGEREVPVTTLDEAVAADGAPLYVKLDVEGAEPDVLRGAESLLAAAVPALAVSVYHAPGDLWEISRRLDGLGLGYRFLLRTHGVDGSDLILYALPPH
jgi:FkbM family methyltransferase